MTSRHPNGPNGPKSIQWQDRSVPKVFLLFLDNKPHLFLLKTQPNKGRAKLLKYSTEQAILLDVGFGAPYDTQVPILMFDGWFVIGKGHCNFKWNITNKNKIYNVWDWMSGGKKDS